MLWPLAIMNCDGLGRLAVNRGNCELKHAVASSHNKLWLPPAAKFSQFVSENYYVMCEQFPNNLTKYGLLMKVYFNSLCDAFDIFFQLSRNFGKKFIFICPFHLPG